MSQSELLLLRAIHSFDRMPVVRTGRVLVHLCSVDRMNIPPDASRLVVYECSSRDARGIRSVEKSPRGVHHIGMDIISNSMIHDDDRMPIMLALAPGQNQEITG